MIGRVRRWWTTCRPGSAAPRTAFQADMKSARAYGVVQQRTAHRSIKRMEAMLREGATEYDELNQALFGRPAWPRDGRGQ